MSAIAEGVEDGPTPVIKVLFALYPGFGAQELVGAHEVLKKALQDLKKSDTKAFAIELVSNTQGTKSSSDLVFKADCDYEDAHDDLSDYDVLVVPGGPLTAIEPILKAAPISEDGEIDTSNGAGKPRENGGGTYPPAQAEPVGLIKAFAALQQKDPSKERTLLSIGLGSLFLGHAGLLQGMGATTHPDHYIKLELICQEAARRGDLEQTDVMEENYVVNNARFDLGDKLDENPFVLSKRPDARRKSLARKGSNAWKESVKRRESGARRAQLRLGGLRVITAGGITSGFDASLYLVAAMVSHESAEEVARWLGYSWNKGVTVDGIDV